MSVYGSGAYGAGIYANPFALVPDTAARGGGAIFRVILGDSDVTPYLEQFAYSNVDPGGFESATLSFPRGVRVSRGERVRIELGCEVVFMGRVSEGQPVFSTTVQVEGIGAMLKDGRMQEIYRDIDLSAWGPYPAQQRLNLISGGFSPTDAQVNPDETTGEPRLACEIQTAAWGANDKPAVSGIYSGNGVPLGSVYWAYDKNTNIALPDANWRFEVYLSTDDVGTTTDSAGITEGTSGSGTLTATAGNRYFSVVELVYDGAGGVDNRMYGLYWTPVVYGRHGLTLRGTEPAAGFYPSDIARDALSRVSGITEGVIETASGLLVPHSVYKDPVTHERPIDDMARLVGWHWGVWEPLSILDDTPRMDFRSIPTQPTAFCNEALMDGHPNLSERLSDLYDTVQVSWSDSAGTRHTTERTTTVDELAETDIAGRVLGVDIGLSSEAAAQTYGDYVLALQRGQARASGDVQLPGGVDTASGVKPAALLKAGLDRLTINDLPATGPILDGVGRVSFHVRRVGVTANRDGVRTTVELDSGANLIEALAAQFQLATEAVA